MSALSHEGGWVSVHLCHAGSIYGYESDRVILEVAVPFGRTLIAEGLAERYFFVRYGGGGAHVRLRIRGVASELGEVTKRTLPAALSSSGIEASIGPVELRWAAYTPETERYGGPRGLLVSEHLFHASSELAAELLCSQQAGERSARLGRGVLATAVLVSGMLCDRQHAVSFLRRYAERALRALVGADAAEGIESAFARSHERQGSSLAPVLAELWRRLEAGMPISAALDDYHQAVVTVGRELDEALTGAELLSPYGPVGTWEDAMDLLLPSFVHMTHNRLGVSTRDEPYVVDLLARTLKQLDQAVAS